MRHNDDFSTPPRFPELTTGNNPFLNEDGIMDGLFGQLDVKEHCLKILINYCQQTLAPAIDNQSQKRDLSKLFDGSFCVGEAHHEISPKKFLIQNIQDLAANGYQVLFFEHLFKAEHQDLLNEYHNSPMGTQMPQALKEKLARLDEGHHVNSKDFNFTKVVEAAKENGIRVVAIDNESIWSMYKPGVGGLSEIDSYHRTLLMNGFAKSIIDAHLANNPNLKWCALMGNSHVNTRSFSDQLPVPGVADLFADCQDIFISDEDVKKPEITSNQAKQVVISQGNVKLVASLFVKCNSGDDLSLSSLSNSALKSAEQANQDSYSIFPDDKSEGSGENRLPKTKRLKPNPTQQKLNEPKSSERQRQ